jgi:hypothetical protein
MSDPIERYANNRTPPRPPEQRTGNPPPGRPGKTLIAKWDVSPNGRDGNRYMGHLWNGDGTQGAAIQWVFLNDPGTDDIIAADEYVEVVKAPEWLAENAAFGAVATYGERYYARAPIWGVIA